MILTGEIKVMLLVLHVPVPHCTDVPTISDTSLELKERERNRERIEGDDT